MESFWWAGNPSRHSLPEAWKSQNQSNDLSISCPTCISPTRPPFSPLWPHKYPSESHEDFRNSTFPFLWPGYKCDFEMFVASGFVCHKRNGPTKIYVQSLGAKKYSFLISTIGVDFWGTLPPSAGNQYILLMGDHFVKWHEAIALPDQSALTTAKASMDQSITRFGCPESLHSDQGRNFEATLFTSLTKLLKLDKTRTTAFRPKSNAVIEKTNRTLLNMLAKTTDKNQRNWSKLLPCV